MKRIFVIVALAAVPAVADDVYLRGGGQITGQIIKETAESVTVDIGGGTISAKMADVARIVKNTSPLQEYRERAAKIPAGDAEAWRKLALWAKGQGLSSQAREAWREVVAILPNDPEANTSLGMVQLDGKWVTRAESYQARGYVQFEGQWMTPNEEASIVAQRQTQQAQAEAAQRANDAKIKEIQAQQEQQKQQEQADAESAQNQVYWGWGAGPVYWGHPGYPRRTYPVTLPAGGRR